MLNLLFSPTGRISRTTWWVSTIILTIGGYAAAFAAAFLIASSLGTDDPSASTEPGWGQVAGLLGVLALVAVGFWCWIALSIKRLHDRNHSAWWMLWYVVPIIGGWVMLITLGFLGGTEGSNRYGDYSI